MRRLFLTSFVIVLLQGCTLLPSKQLPPQEPAHEPVKASPVIVPEYDYATVKVFFATDRNLTQNNNPHHMFGTTRSNITYGSTEVSIPRDHRLGEIESPSIWRLEYREDPSKHVVLLKNEIKSKETFYKEISERVKSSQKDSAFLFIHGYNVSFPEAAKRTAQMTYDLGFDGAPTFYSWPSKGSPMAYTSDAQNIEWSQTNIKNFLDDFIQKSDAKNIYLIAHSMGNRGLTRALTSLLAEKPHLKDRLTEIILTAPDIDADVFKRDIAPALLAAERPISLYVSSKDLALTVSRAVNDYHRAGDSSFGPMIIPGIETIDATHVDTSFMGHSYYASNRSVISDMFYLINHGHRADQRKLRPIPSNSGQYWEFSP